jgi:hypothetical protein
MQQSMTDGWQEQKCRFVFTCMRSGMWLATLFIPSPRSVIGPIKELSAERTMKNQGSSWTVSLLASERAVGLDDRVDREHRGQHYWTMDLYLLHVETDHPTKRSFYPHSKSILYLSTLMFSATAMQQRDTQIPWKSCHDQTWINSCVSAADDAANERTRFDRGHNVH